MNDSSDFFIQNASWLDTLPSAVPKAVPHVSLSSQILITVLYIVGIIGNVAALVILNRGENKMKNKKHALMLRCLAYNDLVALLGMWVHMYLHIYINYLRNSRTFCIFRVIWRIFGLGSGSVATVMALERWIALTHPFFYQKYITYKIIKRSIFCMWTAIFFLACMPFFGFGLYFDSKTSTCVRYKLATEPFDVAYAYLYFACGLLLCICIVFCNLAVIRVLCHVGCGRKRKANYLGRRISRSSSRNNSSISACTTTLSNGAVVSYNASTPDELAFAWLMAVLCIGFLICWLPQLITIPLALSSADSKGLKSFLRLADILIQLHYTCDPYIYVLLRCQRRPCLPNMFKLLCYSCQDRRHTEQTPTPSTKHENCTLTDSNKEVIPLTAAL